MNRLKRLPGGLALLAVMAALVLFSRRVLPPPGDDGAMTRFIDTDGTMLGRVLAVERGRRPGLSGIHPLPGGHDAFAARAALADVAERSIDAQYYIWRDDTTGRLLLQRLRRAADRGVRVRLLLDDNNTKGLDAVLMALDEHPRIEVRLFNPFMHRSARLLDYLGDFARTNRRMHNKSFTVDNQVTVVGGRNVGDEYFGAGEGVMFADLDVLVVGEVVDEVSADFDRYWASASAYPLRSIVTDSVARTEIGIEPAGDAATQGYLEALTRSELVRGLDAGSLSLEWTVVRLVSDDPAKGLGEAIPAQTLLGRLDRVLVDARKDVTIVSPYFVPARQGADLLAGLAQRGVRVTVLTNALSATDVSAVHAGYVKYRQELLRAGVRLFELKPGATVQASGHGGITGSSGASLHAKTFQVDGRQLFVGSFNMDPRSAALNTEMGLLIESTDLANRLSAALAAQGADIGYAVTLEGGELRWKTRESGRDIAFATEPGASRWRRFVVGVLSWLPIEWML